MPKAYSGDLRERVIEAVERGASRREAADRFEISASSAIKWLQRWRKSGSAAPKPRGGSVSPLDSPESRHRYAQRGSGNLNEGSDGGNAGSQTSRHADGSLMANGSHLKGAVLGYGYDERDHSRLGKMDPIDWFTAFLEQLSLFYGNFPQMAAEQRQVGRWKRGEQPIADFLHLRLPVK